MNLLHFPKYLYLTNNFNSITMFYTIKLKGMFTNYLHEKILSSYKKALTNVNNNNIFYTL